MSWSWPSERGGEECCVQKDRPVDAPQVPPFHTSRHPNEELEKQTSQSRVYTLSTVRD